MKELRRNHYFAEGNSLYTVEVVKRDSEDISSFYRIPSTKELVKEYKDNSEALTALFMVVKSWKKAH
ncbi:MAG: hypothetical protein HQK89_08860 [Nitrospirae bacterium]|nr:hypothetical protein [Nitrospirota bacterium]